MDLIASQTHPTEITLNITGFMIGTRCCVRRSGTHRTSVRFISFICGMELTTPCKDLHPSAIHQGGFLFPCHGGGNKKNNRFKICQTASGVSRMSDVLTLNTCHCPGRPSNTISISTDVSITLDSERQAASCTSPDPDRWCQQIYGPPRCHQRQQNESVLSI